MSYLGTLRRKVNIDDMIMQKMKSDQIRMQGFKLQQELKVEIKRD